MGVFTVEVTGYRCERCEHEWLPRNALAEDNDLPTVCPKCKSPYWNRPRENPKPKGRKRRK